MLLKYGVRGLKNMALKQTKYLSILRGINVSGHKKIKMIDLIKLYEDLDLKNVVTYIQSGNVIFSYDAKNEEKLKLLLEKSIKETYGFSFQSKFEPTKKSQIS